MKFSKSIWLILIAVVFPLFGLGQTHFGNLSGRTTTTLNGTWNYIVDPYETGYYNFRQQAYDQQKTPSNAAFYRNYHAKDKQELVEYDFDLAPKMSIPNDWNTQDPKLYYYEGNVWFRRMFDYNLASDRRLFLHFGAVNYIAEVYLNGEKLGTHEGGFTPFAFEITRLVKPKDNFLVVKVDNRRRRDGVPTINTDWWNYGGITRDVRLVDEPSTFIANYKISLKKGDSRRLAGFVAFDGPKPPDQVTIAIPEIGFEKKLRVNGKNRVDFEFESPKLEFWSPDNPKLYRVVIAADGQSLTDYIGFRTVETRGGEILLNGKPVFLRGISIHEESARGGRGYSRPDAARLLNMARELGCNFVRLAHYPHNENMVRLADQMGLLVWEEIPVYWTIDFENPAVLEKSKQQLTETIMRDANRASVVIWSMANETPISDARNRFIRNLVGHTKSLDDTRLISAALMHRGTPEAEIVDDPIGADLDIVAFNQYLGWYGGNLADAEKKKWSIAYDKPVIVSEFGGGARFGRRGAKEERWTEEYMEYLYQQNLKMIDKMPNISGLSPWILADFRSPRRLLPNVQDEYNRKGVYSEKGEKKLAFFVLQDYYKRRGATRELKLVWSDEFDYTGRPDPAKWGYEKGYIRNNEKQYYTDRPENVRVENGNLIIEARREALRNEAFKSAEDRNWRFRREFSEYTSASLTTRDKAEWMYGRIEIRAKVPKGRGAWSALWMLGADWGQVGWPKTGEIDIMENVGFDRDTIHGTVHTDAYNHVRGTQRGKEIVVSDPTENFHVYAVEWTPERIDFLVDGKVYNTFSNEYKSDAEWPFDQKFHLKINNAIGGDWGGKQGIDDASFPQFMTVDWVRVYQYK